MAPGNLDASKGRCRKKGPVGCYVGNHNLKVTIPNAAITRLLSYAFSKGPYPVGITNNNTTVGNINKTISAAASSGDITTRLVPTGFTGGQVTQGIELKRKYFADSVEQIVDGLMVSATEKQLERGAITPDSVEWYFNILTDDEVDGKIACSCASTFNRDSYYIDIDFDCDEISAPQRTKKFIRRRRCAIL